MISALTWVAKGKLKAHPDRHNITESDINKLKAQVPDDSDDDALVTSFAEKQLDDALAKIHNKKISKVHAEEQDAGMEEEEEYVDPNEVADDPYLAEEEDDLEEIDAETIRPTDGIIVAAVAKSEEDEDLSRIEIQIYEEQQNNLYLHHDILLGSFPLCIAYLDCDGSDTVGNYVAVDTILHRIVSFEQSEIWNLDVINIMEPTCTLGGYQVDPTLKKKKSGSKKYLPNSHRGAVMSLSWNRKTRNILASGSADATVKLWDLNTKQCAHTLSHHKKEVQSVEWHPTESSIMLTGSFDRTIQLLDVRSNDPSSYLTWDIPHDCECIQWDPRNPQYFIVGAENGSLYYYDVMKGSKSAPVWTLNAHSKAASCVAINSYVPLMATGSVDKKVKFFDISGPSPKLVDSVDWNCGVFSLSFYDDLPNLLSVGAEQHGLRIMDLTQNEKIVAAFHNKTSSTGNTNTDNGDQEMETDNATQTNNTNNNSEKKKKKKKKKNGKH